MNLADGILQDPNLTKFSELHGKERQLHKIQDICDTK